MLAKLSIESDAPLAPLGNVVFIVPRSGVPVFIVLVNDEGDRGVAIERKQRFFTILVEISVVVHGINLCAAVSTCHSVDRLVDAHSSRPVVRLHDSATSRTSSI